MTRLAALLVLAVVAVTGCEQPQQWTQGERVIPQPVLVTADF